jgi:hypothetical protein
MAKQTAKKTASASAVILTNACRAASLGALCWVAGEYRTGSEYPDDIGFGTGSIVAIAISLGLNRTMVLEALAAGRCG